MSEATSPPRPYSSVRPEAALVAGRCSDLPPACCHGRAGVVPVSPRHSRHHPEHGQPTPSLSRPLRDRSQQRTPAGESPLHELLQIIRNAQSQFERQEWGLVRRIHSRELLTVETALECVLRPNASQLLAYDLARQYSERYNARYGTGLIPESAPMVEDIAEFWGRHFLGRGWKKRLSK